MQFHLVNSLSLSLLLFLFLSLKINILPIFGAQHWDSALKLANELLSQPNGSWEMFQVKKHLREIFDCVNSNGQVTYPIHATQREIALVERALKAHKLAQITDTNCLLPEDQANYIDLHRDFQQASPIKVFVDKYFDLQLNLCHSLLADHFGQIIRTTLELHREAEKFRLNLLKAFRLDEAAPLYTGDTSRIDIQRSMVTFIKLFYESALNEEWHSSIYTELVADLSARCSAYTIQPLRTVVMTWELVSVDAQLRDQVSSDYGTWISAYRLCEVIELEVVLKSNELAQQIEPLFRASTGNTRRPPPPLDSSSKVAMPENSSQPVPTGKRPLERGQSSAPTTTDDDSAQWHDLESRLQELERHNRDTIASILEQIERIKRNKRT